MQSAIPGLPPAPPLVPPLSLSPSPSSSDPPTSPRTPRRGIFTDADLAPWFRSEAYDHVQATILRLTAAVVGHPNEDECLESQATRTLVRFLRDARNRIAQVPLQTSPQRFGNKAFRDWLVGVDEAEPALQQELLSLAPDLPDPLRAAVGPDLRFHLLASFGSAPRLDYGTGHELSFVAFLVCLLRARVFREEDERALVVRVFAEYIETVREVQRVFRLEPAGSKGVWGLDDHQHLVYLFGAAQLVGHPTLRPSSILSFPSSLAAHARSYLFLSSILHIHTLKRGPFHEHSPLVHQIATTVPSFAKVAKGLWEMYRAEVLAKVPVVQHCRFGDVVLRWVDAETREELPSSGDGRAEGEEGEDGTDAVSAGSAGGNGAAQGITPAPWAASSPGSTVAPSVGSVRPLPPPSRLGPSTTTSSSSAAFARREQASTFPLPLTSNPATGTTSFQPPPLFPSRAPSTSGGPGDRRAPSTVADQGGAAAASSPFGVLPRAGLGNGAPRGGVAESSAKAEAEAQSRGEKRTDGAAGGTRGV